MEALYQERASWLHAWPAGLKLALMAVLGTLVFLVPSPLVLLGLATGCALAVASLGALAGGARKLLVAIAIAAALILGFHAWLGQAQVGAVSSLRLLIGCLLGILLAATTRYTQLLGVLETLLAPLARLGVRTERLALAVALMLRFVDNFFAHWQRLDEAHRVRTGRPGGLRLLAPLTIAMLRQAQRVADTLALRLPRP